MEKRIAILLPYKEKYTLKDAAAASIWVKDYLKEIISNKQSLAKPETAPPQPEKTPKKESHGFPPFPADKFTIFGHTFDVKN